MLSRLPSSPLLRMQRALIRSAVLLGALAGTSESSAQLAPAPEPTVIQKPGEIETSAGGPQDPEAAAALPSLSADRGCPERYLVLQVEPTLSEGLAHEIGVDLSVELQARGIGVCAAQRSDVPPLALVTLRQTESVLSIELDDHMTQKRVQRDLSLLKVPESGRALAAAIAVDELLRASWAELTMGSARQIAEPAPAPRASEEPLQPYIAPPRPRARWGALSISAGYSHGSASWNALLAGASLTLWPRSWLWLQVGIFGLRTSSIVLPLGKLHARGVVAEATLGVCPWNNRRLLACAGARTGVDFVAFQASANPSMAQAFDRNATGAHLQGVVALGFPLARRLLLTTELGLGGPLQEVVATDGDRPLLGTKGPLWTLSLGLGVTR